MSARYVMAGYWAGIVAIMAAVLALPASDQLVEPSPGACWPCSPSARSSVGVRAHRPRRRLALGAAGRRDPGLDRRRPALRRGPDAARRPPLLAWRNAAYLVMFVASRGRAAALRPLRRRGLEQAGLVDAVTVTVVLLLLIYVTVVSPARAGPDRRSPTRRSSPTRSATRCCSPPWSGCSPPAAVPRPVLLLVAGAAARPGRRHRCTGLSRSAGRLHEAAVTDLGWLLLTRAGAPPRCTRRWPG